MIPNRHISQLRPEADETLMSFLRRAQDDAGYSEDGFSSLLSGTPVLDSRLAERREFDWWSVSRFFNATPQELHALSERSVFYEMGDSSCRGHFRQRAPWVQMLGYSAHSPAALKESAYWRKSWLGPAALVCCQHRTVLVRHCHGCGEELATMTWRRPSPICPRCCAHLALGPVIPASGELLRHAGAIGSRYEELISKRPVDRHDYELAYFAVLWRATRLLQREWRFSQFRTYFAEWVGLSDFAGSCEVSQKAMRHAQCAIIAHVICEMEPTLVEHYWLLAGSRRDFKQADAAVLLKLTEFVETFYAKKLSAAPVRGQTMMSFASWSGWNDSPKAA